MFSKGDLIEWVFTDRTWARYGESTFRQDIVIDIMEDHYVVVVVATNVDNLAMPDHYATVNIKDSSVRLLGRLSKEEMLTHWNDEVRELGHAEDR